LNDLAIRNPQSAIRNEATMSDLSALFREIHRLHRFVRDLREGIERYPRSLKTQMGRVTFAEQQLKDEQDAIKRLKVTSHEKEVDLKAREGQIERSRKKLVDVSEQRQIDALNSEIVQGKEAVGQLEEEILNTLAEIEERAAGLPKLEQTLATARAEYATFEAAATAKKVEQEVLLKQAVVDLAEAEKGIPSGFRDGYQRNIKAKGADALSLVKDLVCTACKTTLTAQHLLNLQGNQFATCSTCGRILYLPAAVAAREDDE
jgi:predicted  nucleic acid-binding Zn-ribbon protein